PEMRLVIALVALSAAKMNTAPIKAELIKKHGEAQKERIERGVDQAAALWRKEDGDFGKFAADEFIADQPTLDATLARFETNFEALDGHFLEIQRTLKTPTDLDLGDPLELDKMFSGYDASSHLTEDLFNNRIGFVALLNY